MLNKYKVLVSLKFEGWTEVEAEDRLKAEKEAQKRLNNEGVNCISKLTFCNNSIIDIEKLLDKVKSEDPKAYKAKNKLPSGKLTFSAYVYSDDEIVEKAKVILEKRVEK